MRRTWQSFYQPSTLAEALELRDRFGDAARIVAGGTDVVVELSRGVKPTSTLIDVTRIEQLRGIVETEQGIQLGALATHNDVLASTACVRDSLPLAQACLEIGAPQLRSRATVAGNVVTGSPANDTISALMALDAVVTLTSLEGERRVRIAEFYPGFRQTVVQPDELVTSILIPRPEPGERGLFVKLGLRRAQAISVVHFAIVANFDGDVVRSARVDFGCLAPTVVRGAATEAWLAGKELTPEVCAEAGRIALEDVSPIDDIRGSADYRRVVLARLVADALVRLREGREREGFPGSPILLESDTTYPQSTWTNEVVDSIAVEVNGEPMSWGAAATQLTLLDAIREHAGLTGAKEGCAEGECGACTVWLEGRAVMACLVPAAQAIGSKVTSIEGLAATSGMTSNGLHPLQQAFIDQGAVQCGFCIPGMVMAGAKLLEERPEPNANETQVALSGNICRCTGYRKILAAVDQAVKGGAA
jgi:carbon-monoxide dehydrogenase medium subunit